LKLLPEEHSNEETKGVFIILIIEHLADYKQHVDTEESDGVKNKTHMIPRTLFMFVEDTDRYFNDIPNIISKGIRQIGWCIKDNSRMKNKLVPQQIADEYTKRGWTVELEYLDWYKSVYFINAYKL